MEIRSLVPFVKLIGKPKDYWFFQKRRLSPCVVMDVSGLFLSNNNKWVNSINLAWVGTFSEMYEKVKSIDRRNGLTFVFVKL